MLFDRSPIIKSQRQTPLWCHKSMFAWICTNLTNYQVSFITTSIESYQALQIPGLQFTPRRKWLQHQVSLCFNCQGQVHPAKLESDCWENEKTRLLYLNKNPLSGICWDYLDHKMGQSLLLPIILFNGHCSYTHFQPCVNDWVWLHSFPSHSTSTIPHNGRCEIGQRNWMQSVQKVLLRFLPQSAPCPVCFTLWYLNTTWVHVMHVLDMLWVSGVCNMSLGMLCALWNIDNMRDYESQTCQGIAQLFLQYMNRAKARLWEKIAAVLLY